MLVCQPRTYNRARPSRLSQTRVQEARRQWAVPPGVFRRGLALSRPVRFLEEDSDSPRVRANKLKEDLDRESDGDAGEKPFGKMVKSRKGRFFEDDGIDFKRAREPTRKELARDAALTEADIEVDDDDPEAQYFIGNTLIPYHLEHWFEDPFGVKNGRDKYLMDKANKMKQRLLEKEQLKGTGNKIDQVSTKMTRRMLRVAHMIRGEVNKIFHDPPTSLTTQPKNTGNSAFFSSVLSRSMVSITRSEMSRDLLHCKLYWTCLPGNELLVKKELDALSAKLRHLVTQRVYLKYSPEIKFIRDAPTQWQVESMEAVNQARMELLQSYGIAKGLGGVNSEAIKSDLQPVAVNYGAPAPTSSKPANYSTAALPPNFKPARPTADFSEWLKTQRKSIPRKPVAPK